MPLVISMAYLLGKSVPGLVKQYSFWFDEIYTVGFIQDSWREMFSEWIIQDVHPPLYFILAKLWSYGFGITELSLRALSLLWSAATVILLWKYWEKRKNFARISLLALFISNPFFLFYSQEARSYSMLMFLSLAVLLLSLKLRKEIGRQKNLALYYILILCTSLTHYFGLMYAFVILLIDLIEARVQLRRYKTVLALIVISLWPIIHLGIFGSLGNEQAEHIALE